MAALTRLCETDVDAAATVLGLGERQRDAIAANARLAAAPAAPARDVYCGVLYEALGLSELPGEIRDAAHRRLLIFSGLWGVVRPDDRIPAYRCSVTVKLPELAGEKPIGMGAFWRPRLTAELPAVLADEFVLDLRSSGYAAMWRPRGNCATVRVIHEREVDGVLTRSIVSHFNKATKGRMVADLLRAGVDAATPDELAQALRDLKYRVEPGDSPARLDVVVDRL